MISVLAQRAASEGECKGVRSFLCSRSAHPQKGLARRPHRSANCRKNGGPSRLCKEGRRKLTESAKEFPKNSAWQSPNGPFPKALKRRAMLPRLQSPA